MDTERYQALMDTLEQIKSRADDAQEDLRSDARTISVVRFHLDRIVKLCHKAADEADEAFRAEEV